MSIEVAKLGFDKGTSNPHSRIDTGNIDRPTVRENSVPKFLHAFTSGEVGLYLYDLPAQGLQFFCCIEQSLAG